MREVVEISKHEGRSIRLYVEGNYTKKEFINTFDYLADGLRQKLSDQPTEAVFKFLRECNPPTKKTRRNAGKPYGNKRKQQILEVLRGGIE